MLAAPPARAGLPTDTLEALQRSDFVYVSPLRSDGGESRCHGEVWYAWLDGAVVLTTGAERWKARALRRGLDRARLWVGNHGRWKQLFGTNEAFRRAPSFLAKASISKDRSLNERLLAVYEDKYPAEIGRWRDEMREGFADGSRALIRYRPEAAERT